RPADGGRRPGRRHRDQRAGPGRVARPHREVQAFMNTGLARRNAMHVLTRSCLLACLLPAAAIATELPTHGASGEALLRHVQVLASDAFEGRAPATAGEEKTIAYLVEEFRKAGVQPGGEDGGWTQ